jgi:hypothetical protein
MPWTDKRASVPGTCNLDSDSVAHHYYVVTYSRDVTTVYKRVIHTYVLDIETESHVHMHMQHCVIVSHQLFIELRIQSAPAVDLGFP